MNLGIIGLTGSARASHALKNCAPYLLNCRVLVLRAPTPRNLTNFDADKDNDEANMNIPRALVPLDAVPNWRERCVCDVKLKPKGKV